jgi:transposase
VIKAIEGGMNQTTAARQFGVSRVAVNGWVKKWREGGVEALRTRRLGRPAETRLTKRQTERVIYQMVGHCPDQLSLPFVLWTREAVQQLLKREFGIEVSVWTVGRYLQRWGLTPQKPARRAFEQNPEEVRQWLEVEYPAIQRRAKQEGAEIHWGDEMGLRSDHQAGRSYSLKGLTPVIPGTGQRFRCNMISTVTNRGEMAFMLFRENFDVKVQLKFLRRLLRHTKRKVFWIVDRHSVHKAVAVTRWIKARPDRIERFYLPAYSPELNPDEFLNQDVKANALGRKRPHDAEEMEDDVHLYLRSTQRRPDVVRRYFHAPTVRYAAG